MEHVQFSGRWGDYFHRQGLRTLDDFFQLPRRGIVGRNARRDVQKFLLREEGDPEAFFIKRFWKPQAKDILSPVRRFGRLIPQARIEWENALYLLNEGIGTYIPVCVGWRTVMGIERRSFLVTRALEAQCLLEYVMDHWDSLHRRRQEEIVTAAGELAQRIHLLGVSFPDLYLWHLFLHGDGPDEGGKLSIIDLHRMTRSRPSRRKRILEFAKLYWSMPEEYFDEGHRALLVRAYAGAGSSSSVAAVVSSAKSYRDRTRKRTRRYCEMYLAGGYGKEAGAEWSAGRAERGDGPRDGGSDAARP